MRIEIDVDEKYSDLTVEIKTPQLTPEIERIISLMRMINMQIAVKKVTRLFFWIRMKFCI